MGKDADGSVTMFMDFLGYGNHVELYSEEISRGGEGLGVSPTWNNSGKLVKLMIEHPASVLTRHADLRCVQPGPSVEWWRHFVVNSSRGRITYSTYIKPELRSMNSHFAPGLIYNGRSSRHDCTLWFLLRDLLCPL